MFSFLLFIACCVAFVAVLGLSVVASFVLCVLVRSSQTWDSKVMRMLANIVVATGVGVILTGIGISALVLF